MSDRFEVPEPSTEAVQKAADAWRYCNDEGQWLKLTREQVIAAYAVDLPAIVRAEVERALNAMPHYPPLLDAAYEGAVTAYLAARFPEAAPEFHVCPPPCAACTCSRCTAERDFLRALARVYFAQEANQGVLKYSDVFLAARAVLQESR